MGRGGGGAGRSSGGGSRGGSRSSGGSRGGGSSSRGGFSGGGSFRSSPSRGGHSPGPSRSYRSAPPPPPRPHYHGGPGYHYGGRPRPVRRTGCLTSILTTVVVLVILIAVIGNMSLFGAGGSITASTVSREPLDKQYVTTTEYYQDNIGWISSSSKLESGMKFFFKETGIQPYLYLTETVNGSTYPSESEMDTFANALYDSLFEDEGHLLVVFQEYNSDGNYYCYYVAGKQAKTVFDSEAADILFDYIDHYYYSDLSEEEFFSQAFAKTGERMMEKTESPMVKIVMVIGAVAIVAIAFVWWKKAKARKAEEAAETERILNTPISKIEDESLNELENKYQ